MSSGIPIKVSRSIFQLIHPISERGDVSVCNALASRYSDCVRSQKLIPKEERMSPGKKLVPPPPCEMESAVYGQCMANLLDNEVRRKGHYPATPGDVKLDTNRCKFTLAAFEKCLNSAPETRMTEEPQVSVNQAGTYYWMSSIYWQAPSKSVPPSG